MRSRAHKRCSSWIISQAKNYEETSNELIPNSLDIIRIIGLDLFLQNLSNEKTYIFAIKNVLNKMSGDINKMYFAQKECVLWKQ